MPSPDAADRSDRRRAATPRRRRGAVRAGQRPDPVDRARHRELGCAQPLHDVAAPGSVRSPPWPAAPGRRPANPPVTRSVASAPRVSTPCRSRNASARACARRVGSGSRTGRERPPPAHRRRPAPAGHRRPPAAQRRVAAARRRAPAAVGARRRPRPPPSRARSGASVSFAEQPGPDQVPDRRDHGVVARRRLPGGDQRPARRIGELAEEQGSAAVERLQQAPGAAEWRPCRVPARAAAGRRRPRAPARASRPTPPAGRSRSS